MRYVAAAGPPDALDRLSRQLAEPGKPALTTALAVPGLTIWSMPATPVVVGEDGQSAAIGLVFERSGGERLARLPALLRAETTFTARFWGAYVLFALKGETGHLVLRDPSGNVTAYHRRVGPLDVYASDGPLLAVATSGEIAPDVAFLRNWLTYPFLRAEAAGWSGASEIIPGTVRRVVGGTASVATVWSPWDYAGDDSAIEDPDAAAALVRDAIRLVVPRLAGEAADPVVRLSGGLDSAIVAAALFDAGYSFRAVTFATRAPDGDERAYSRAAAREWDIPLAELLVEPALPDFGSPASFTLRPPPNALLQRVHRAVENHLTVTNSDLVLGGTGGDNVFCHLGSASPVIDAFRARGVGTALGAIKDLSRLHGATLRTVFRAAYRRSRRERPQWRRDETFLASGAAAAEPAFHPWLQAPARTLRGKYEHVQSIVSVRHFLADPDAGRTPAIHPLLAQPVLEACLRVPTWLWVQGGRDRSIARAAFRDLLPEAILSRRSKGSLGSLVMAGYMAGRSQLQQLLLDGQMAQLGLLDCDTIRAYLDQTGEPSDASYIRLLDMAAAEVWLRAFDT